MVEDFCDKELPPTRSYNWGIADHAFWPLTVRRVDLAA